MSDDEMGALSRRVCDRHFGIGADGLLIVGPGNNADFEMKIYNSDGSRAETCGNGIRCVSKYVMDQNMTGGTKFTVESMGSVRTVEALGKNEQGEALLRVEMGVPVLGEEHVFDFEGERIGVTSVSMGNPHAVLIQRKDKAYPVEELGPLLERAPFYPDGANVEFVTVLDENHVEMRVWERGVGETLSCGTGACAASTVCMQKGLTDEEIAVKLLGGELLITKERETGRLYLTGSAVTTFEGDMSERLLM